MKNLLFKAPIAITFLSLATRVYADTIEVPPPANVVDVKIGYVISAVIGVLLIVAAIAAFLFLILGGLQWITSGGDKTGMEAARNKITSAIVGLIIVAAAWAVMLLLGEFTGVKLLQGGMNIPTIEDPGGTGG